MAQRGMIGTIVPRFPVRNGCVGGKAPSYNRGDFQRGSHSLVWRDFSRLDIAVACVLDLPNVVARALAFWVDYLLHWTWVST